MVALRHCGPLLRQCMSSMQVSFVCWALTPTARRDGSPQCRIAALAGHHPAAATVRLAEDAARATSNRTSSSRSGGRRSRRSASGSVAAAMVTA